MLRKRENKENVKQCLIFSKSHFIRFFVNTIKIFFLKAFLFLTFLFFLFSTWCFWCQWIYKCHASDAYYAWCSFPSLSIMPMEERSWLPNALICWCEGDVELIFYYWPPCSFMCNDVIKWNGVWKNSLCTVGLPISHFVIICKSSQYSRNDVTESLTGYVSTFVNNINPTYNSGSSPTIITG